MTLYIVNIHTKALTFENICQAYPPTSQHKQTDGGRDPAANTSALRAHSDQVCERVRVYTYVYNPTIQRDLTRAPCVRTANRYVHSQKVLYIVTIYSKYSMPRNFEKFCLACAPRPGRAGRWCHRPSTTRSQARNPARAASASASRARCVHAD